MSDSVKSTSKVGLLTTMTLTAITSLSRQPYVTAGGLFGIQLAYELS